MLKNLTKTLAAATVIMGATTQAQAGTNLGDVWIKDLSIGGQFATPPKMWVESEKGSYTGVKLDAVTYFPIHVHADVKNAAKKYKILTANVYTTAIKGYTPSDGIKTNVMPLSANGSGYDGHPRKIDSKTFVALTGEQIKTAGLGWRAVKACQDAVSAGKPSSQSHSTFISTHLVFRVSAGDTDPGFGPWADDIVEKSDSVTIKTQVVCLPSMAPIQTADDFAPAPVDFKVKGIELFLSTFSNATTEPNAATTCKKGRVLVRLKASKAGNAKFQLWTKVGDAAMTSKVIDAWASHDGNGGYEAEYTEWVSVDKTSYFQAKAEELVSGFGTSTAWKDITLQCSDQGSGLTTQSDEPQAPPLSLKGDFSFVDHGAPRCAREGKALISFATNKSGDINYSLDCTNGQSFSGVATAVKNPAGGYVAAALKTFNITKSTVYSCALKTSAPGAAKLHQWKSHSFDCIIPAIIPPVGGLQVAPKPNADARDVPAPVDAVVATPNRDAINARLKAAQEAAEAKRRQDALIAAEAKRRQDALIAAQRLQAAQQQQINALRLQQAIEAKKRQAKVPAVQAVPQLRVQRPAPRRR